MKIVLLASVYAIVLLGCTHSPSRPVSQSPFQGTLLWKPIDGTLTFQSEAMSDETTWTKRCPTLTVANDFLCPQPPPYIPANAPKIFEEMLRTERGANALMRAERDYFETHDSNDKCDVTSVGNGMLRLCDGEIVPEPPDD